MNLIQQLAQRAAAAGRVAAGVFHGRQQARIEAARAQRAARQRDGEVELLLDDLRSGFAGRAALERFAAREDRDSGYRSAIGEDFPGDL
jgi:hypothetical protein